MTDHLVISPRFWCVHDSLSICLSFPHFRLAWFPESDESLTFYPCRIVTRAPHAQCAKPAWQKPPHLQVRAQTPARQRALTHHPKTRSIRPFQLAVRQSFIVRQKLSSAQLPAVQFLVPGNATDQSSTVWPWPRFRFAAAASPRSQIVADTTDLNRCRADSAAKPRQSRWPWLALDDCQRG